MNVDKMPRKRGITNLYSDGATIEIVRDGKPFREKHVSMASDAPEQARKFITANLPYLMKREWECFIIIKHK